MSIIYAPWTDEQVAALNCACCGEFLRFEDKDVHIATEEEFDLMDPIRKTMALLAQQLVRSEGYQKQLKAKLNKQR